MMQQTGLITEALASETFLRVYEGRIRFWMERFHRHRPWISRDDLLSEGRLALLQSMPYVRALEGKVMLAYIDRVIRRQMRRWVQGMPALPQAFGEGSPLESISDPTAIDPELRDRLSQFLHFLPSRWQQVLSLHYGLDGEKPLSFRRIARVLKVSSQRIAQLHQAALERLRWHFE